MAASVRQSFLWTYVLAVVFFGVGATGILNLFSPPASRLGGGLVGNILLMSAPAMITAGLLSLWFVRLMRVGVRGADLLRISKSLGWISLVMIFVIPIVAAVGIAATMKSEAGWIYIFVPSYVSFGAGIAVLVFSGVLSHVAHRDERTG